MERRKKMKEVWEKAKNFEEMEERVEQLKDSRKALNVLLDKVSNEDLEDLLVELHNLRSDACECRKLQEESEEEKSEQDVEETENESDSDENTTTNTNNREFGSRGSGYTDDELEILQNSYEDGLGAKEIASKLPNRSASSVRNKLYNLGLKLSDNRSKSKSKKSKKKYDRSGKKWSKEEDEVLRKGFEKGLTGKEIAENVPGRTKNSVYVRLNNLGYMFNERDEKKWYQK